MSVVKDRAVSALDAPLVKPLVTAVKAKGRKEIAMAVMPVAALVGLLIALAIANPRLVQSRSLLTLADSAAPLIVLAAGATIVVLCGGIDLSIAALASMASVLLALWSPGMSGGSILLVIAVCAVAGFVQGLIHVVFRIPSFIVTLGGMTVWSALALLLSGASTIPIKDSSVTDWAFTRIGKIVPSAVLIALGVVAVLGLALWLTPLRRWVSAIGHAEAAARLAGIPVDRVKVLAFTLSGACAGLAGVLVVARTFSGAPTLADSLLLPAVAAIVVGGTAITGGHGALWRTVVGASIVTLLRVGLSLIGIDAAYESIVYGALIIGSVALTIDRSKISIVK